MENIKIRALKLTQFVTQEYDTIFIINTNYIGLLCILKTADFSSMLLKLHSM